ncbi:MAG: helix-turn-helix domain-containing protein [Acidimicrobiales bacterium]
MAARSFPPDVKLLSWAAEQLGIGESTAYRIAPHGQIPGAFKVGAQWRVSVPKFMRDVHGFDPDQYRAASVVEPQR